MCKIYELRRFYLLVCHALPINFAKGVLMGFYCVIKSRDLRLIEGVKGVGNEVVLILIVNFLIND